MDTSNGPAAQTWPLEIRWPLLEDPAGEAVVHIRAGINTLVGPNGSSKTRALPAIKAALATSGQIEGHGRKIHFLAAGRSSPLETFRAAIDSPGAINQQDAAVGQAHYRQQWWQIESVTGGLLALDARADLRLKVEA